MSKGRRGMPGHGKKVKRKENKYDTMIEAIAIYGELAGAAIPYLKKNNQWTANLEIRMTIESHFCYRLLFNMFGLSEEFIADLVKRVHEDDKRFKAQLEKFCAGVTGKGGVLVTDNLDQEMASIMARKKRDDLIKGGSLLIR